MTFFQNQNDPFFSIMSENSCHFVNLLSLANNYFFSSSCDQSAKSPKLEKMQTTQESTFKRRQYRDGLVLGLQSQLTILATVVTSRKNSIVLSKTLKQSSLASVAKEGKAPRLAAAARRATPPPAVHIDVFYNSFHPVQREQVGLNAFICDTCLCSGQYGSRRLLLNIMTSY